MDQITQLEKEVEDLRQKLREKENELQALKVNLNLVSTLSEFLISK